VAIVALTCWRLGLGKRTSSPSPSPPPSPPPLPSPPPPLPNYCYTVSWDIVAAGVPSEFDEPAFQSSLASVLDGVEAADIAVETTEVGAGGVAEVLGCFLTESNTLVDVEISTCSETTADDAVALLDAYAADLASAETALDLGMECAEPSVKSEGSLAPAPPLPPPTQSSPPSPPELLVECLTTAAASLAPAVAAALAEGAQSCTPTMPVNSESIDAYVRCMATFIQASEDVCLEAQSFAFEAVDCVTGYTNVPESVVTIVEDFASSLDCSPADALEPEPTAFNSLERVLSNGRAVLSLLLRRAVASDDGAAGRGNSNGRNVLSLLLGRAVGSDGRGGDGGDSVGPGGRDPLGGVNDRRADRREERRQERRDERGPGPF